MTGTDSARRDSIHKLDVEIVALLSRLKGLVESVSADVLYRNLSDASQGSIGEHVVKSAATLERAFGGLTSNLWDDPFEWTLPETLSTPDHILQYLIEVDSSRRRALATLVDDLALEKYIAVPSGDQVSIRSLLEETLDTARLFAERAVSLKKPFRG